MSFTVRMIYASLASSHLPDSSDTDGTAKFPNLDKDSVTKFQLENS